MHLITASVLPTIAMETVHHRAQVIHVVDDQQTDLKLKDESRSSQASSSYSSLDVRYDIGLNEKSDFSKSHSNQSKKELYIKLDEILISSLHESFEVCPGATVDRVEMVEFLSKVVRQNLSVCPDLEKIMCLRDTVLTARVKRAFPEVEYKRKQIRQDHFRKAWLYVNIKKKVKTQDGQNTDTKKAHEGSTPTSASKTSVSATGTWTPGVSKPQNTQRPVPKKQTPLNTQLPSTIDHHPDPDTTRRNSTENNRHHQDRSSYRKLAPLPSGAPVSMVTGFAARENSAVVLDNYTIIKWVKTHYVEDSTTYVPVQDVVKAFKTTYGVDITYKECHQMIYSAFTSPRQRTCPLKTVRVSSMGAQYVYRGIAAVRAENNDNFDEDSYLEASPPDPIVHCDSIQEEREDVWRKLVEELKQERDQSIIDRNQALSALMDLEKEHSKALSVIDQLRKDLSEKQLNNEPRLFEEKSTATKIREAFERIAQSSSASKADSTSMASLGTKCHNCRTGKQTYEHLNEEKDQIWKDIIKQTTAEKEEARKRLEVVKRERDSYLERLHAFEKENQRLRDAVALPSSPTHVPDNELAAMQALKLENRAKALRNSMEIESRKNSRDSLNSALSHLRSKRKQSTPTKFNKVPRLLNAEAESTSFVDSGSSPLDKLCVIDDFNGDQNPQATTPSNNAEREMESSPETSQDPTELLLYFDGSDMVAFKPHPMED